MEVQQLKYFISVIESGSLSRAAASLHMSQSALSQQMRALERSLNATLLERSTRGVRPTTAGESLYRDAFRLVREFDHLATSVSAETDIRGVVSVGLPSGAATQLAAPLVTWVLEHYPGIRLELIDAMSGYIRELLSPCPMSHPATDRTGSKAHTRISHRGSAPSAMHPTRARTSRLTLSMRRRCSRLETFVQRTPDRGV